MLGVNFRNILNSLPEDCDTASMGVYRGAPTASANTPTSSTATMGFLVSFTHGEGIMGVQLYFENNGNQLIWVRTRSKSSEEWKAWRSIATTV